MRRMRRYNKSTERETIPGSKENLIMNTDKIFAEQMANEYVPKDTSRVIALRKLDRRAKRPARVFSYIFGSVMALVLGIGMCLSMKVIGDGSSLMMGVGIAVGVVGIAGVSVNYALYRRLLEKGKRKYASDILRLAREISGEQA
jgi:uncharacterized membrane protein